MALFRQSKTLDEKNQFHLVCPIFNAETPIAACFKLRDIVWRGERPTVRRGCQCAMRASKCPINMIIKDLGRRDDDPYYSVTKTVGYLEAEHLERIAPISIIEAEINRHNLGEKEIELIMRANQHAAESVTLKGKTKTKGQRQPKPVKQTLPSVTLADVPTPERSEPTSNLTKAAMSGDMSAAINRALEAAPPPPQPPDEDHPARGEEELPAFLNRSKTDA